MDSQASHNLDRVVNHPAMGNHQARRESGNKLIPHTYILVLFSLRCRTLSRNFEKPLAAEIWEVRRMCFLRLRVSSTGLSLSKTLMDQTNQLKLAIEEELSNIE